MYRDFDMWHLSPDDHQKGALPCVTIFTRPWHCNSLSTLLKEREYLPPHFSSSNVSSHITRNLISCVFATPICTCGENPFCTCCGETQMCVPNSHISEEKQKHAQAIISGAKHAKHVRGCLSVQCVITFPSKGGFIWHADFLVVSKSFAAQNIWRSRFAVDEHLLLIISGISCCS